MAKKNCRPVSIHNSVIRLIEKIIQKQLNPFLIRNFETLCGYVAVEFDRDLEEITQINMVIVQQSL